MKPVVVVSPSTGPRIVAVTPGHVSFGLPVTISLTGGTDPIQVTLSRSNGDPDDPTDGRPNPGTTHSTGPWQLATTPALGGLVARLPNPELVPGQRVLTVTNLAGGSPAGSDSATVTVAPAITSIPPLRSSDPVMLQVAHVLAEGLVAFGGVTAGYTVTSPTSVTVTVPAALSMYAGGQIAVSVESGTIAGPPEQVEVLS